jgi:hypothetical protein
MSSRDQTTTVFSRGSIVALAFMLMAARLASCGPIALNYDEPRVR